MNVEIGRQNIIILFRNNEGRAVSFLGINEKIWIRHTLDSHRPFICSVLCQAKKHWRKVWDRSYLFFSRCPNKIFKTFLIEDFFLFATGVFHLELWISQRIFNKFWNRGLGGNWFMKKTWSWKSRDPVPLNFYRYYNYKKTLAPSLNKKTKPCYLYFFSRYQRLEMWCIMKLSGESWGLQRTDKARLIKARQSSLLHFLNILFSLQISFW